jgi:integrase
MSIRQRGKGGIWYARFTLPSGEPFEKSTGTTDKKLAQEVHDKWKHDAWRRDKLGEKPERYWEEAANRWLDESEANRKDSVRDEEQKIEWFNLRLSGKPLSKIDEDVINDLVKAKRAGSNRYGKPVSNSTINRYLALLRAILRKAWLDWKWMNEGYRPPVFRLFKEPKRRLRWITPHQVELLLKELPDHQRDMVTFALAVGLRQGNVKSLTWEQVDMHRRVAMIDAEDVKNEESIGIPLNRVAMQVLERRKTLFPHPKYVFTYKGSPVKQVNTLAWRNALKRAGITNFRWHDLRHTWATWLRMSGAPTSDLQEMGGWADERMVKRYAHVSTDHLMTHATALDRFLIGASEGSMPSIAQQNRANSGQMVKCEVVSS